MTSGGDPYPGRRPDGPVLVWQERTWPLDRELSAPEAAGDAPVLTAADRRWIVAYGGNASPQRLVQKGLDRFGALLLPAVVEGWATATEDRIAKHGAAPLTIVPRPGARLDTWVVGVHPTDLAALDVDEGRGERYIVGSLGDAAVAARWRLSPALAYGPAPRTRLRPVDGTADGAPALPDPVDDWPPTALTDLDLFVYGSLQPGEERWPIVADLVDVVGETSTAGTLIATPMGWPAAVLVDASAIGEVHGTLLRPTDPDAADELYRRCDRVEDEGNLFERVAVRTDLGWTAAYRWHPTRGRPPGDERPDGRWRPRGG